VLGSLLACSVLWETSFGTVRSPCIRFGAVSHRGRLIASFSRINNNTTPICEAPAQLKHHAKASQQKCMAWIYWPCHVRGNSWLYGRRLWCWPSNLRAAPLPTLPSMHPLCTLPEFIPTLPPDTTSPAFYNLYSLQSAFFQIIDSRWQGLELRIALFFCFAYYYSFSMCILLMHLVQAT
jgi:hypothetical protein